MGWQLNLSGQQVLFHSASPMCPKWWRGCNAAIPVLEQQVRELDKKVVYCIDIKTNHIFSIDIFGQNIEMPFYRQSIRPWSRVWGIKWWRGFTNWRWRVNFGNWKWHRRISKDPVCFVWCSNTETNKWARHIDVGLQQGEHKPNNKSCTAVCIWFHVIFGGCTRDWLSDNVEWWRFSKVG